MIRFKKIYIEITNFCNLACSFCPPSGRTGAFMSSEQFGEILRKISGFTEHICLHVLGEPLLHPDLGSFLALCHMHHLHVNLTTNGTLLGPRRDILFGSPALRQVNVSLQSARQWGPAEEGYLDGVFDFIRGAGSPPPMFVNLRLWNLRPDGSTPTLKILERLASFFASPALLLQCIPGRNLTLAPGVFLSFDRQFVWPDAASPELGNQGRCRGLQDHIAILVDGTVVPCCLDSRGDIALGNIFQESLAGILTDRRSVAMRDGFLRQQIMEPLCRRCGYRKRFASFSKGLPAGKHA